MKLSIVTPVYNEERTIANIIDRVLAVALPQNLSKELIIVDDGSTDGTREILKRYSSNPQIKIFLQEKNRGKSAAVIFGLEQATGDIILIQDADLEYRPEDYPILLDPILKENQSVVYGSRFKGKIKDMFFVNRWANNFSTMSINSFYGTQLTDFHTGFKVFKKDVVKNIKLTSQNFSFDTEITAKLLNKGYRIHEVPITYTARSKSEGKKITWSHAIETYFVLLKCRCFPGRD